MVVSLTLSPPGSFVSRRRTHPTSPRPVSSMPVRFEHVAHPPSRLHHYVKQGLPYPDEYRYGPGHPPPPNPHLRTASRASVHAPQGNYCSFAIRLSLKPF